MATTRQLIDIIESALDGLERDLGLSPGQDIPVSPLPTLKQMTEIVSLRAARIDAAVQPQTPIPPTPAPLPQPSPDGTEMPPAETMVDSAGQTWWMAGEGDRLRLIGGIAHRVSGTMVERWTGSGWEVVTAPLPSPPVNRAPVWATTTTLEFISGVPKAVRLADFVTDADGDVLQLSLQSGTFGSGFIYDEASDELRYDGRELPPGDHGVFTVLADDGKN